MKVTTYMSREAFESLEANGVYVPNASLSELASDYAEAYAFIAESLQVVDPNPDKDASPVWAWPEGSEHGNEMELYESDRRPYKVEIEVDEQKCLFTDFFLYECSALLNIPLEDEGATAEEVDALYEQVANDPEKLKATWRKMIKTTCDEECQINFWSFSKEQVVKVTLLPPPLEREEEWEDETDDQSDSDLERDNS